MAEITINGKTVVLREHFPAKDYKDLPRLITSMEAGDPMAMVPVHARFIKEWELEGDPTDPETYEELDLFREVIPLNRAMTQYLGELMDDSGNSDRASG